MGCCAVQCLNKGAQNFPAGFICIPFPNQGNMRSGEATLVIEQHAGIGSILRRLWCKKIVDDESAFLNGCNFKPISHAVHAYRISFCEWAQPPLCIDRHHRNRALRTMLRHAVQKTHALFNAIAFPSIPGGI